MSDKFVCARRSVSRRFEMGSHDLRPLSVSLHLLALHSVFFCDVDYLPGGDMPIQQLKPMPITRRWHAPSRSANKPDVGVEAPVSDQVVWCS